MSSVVNEIEGYIKAKEVDTLFKAFLVKCFRQRPASPVEFFFDYLIENYPEIARTKGGLGAPSEQTGDDACAVTVKHAQPDSHEYLNKELDVGLVFTFLSTQLAESRPDDPLAFMIHALQRAQSVADDEGRPTLEEVIEEEEEETEEEQSEAGSEAGSEKDDLADLKAFQARVAGHGNRRQSVSAECATEGEEAKELPSYPKSESDRARIRKVFKDNILFKDLDDQTRTKVEDAVFPVEFKEGDVIIKQGDEGDNFYIVDQGQCEVYVKSGDAPEKLVFTAAPGNSFGELALMYNSPRAATVIAKGACKLWALDRSSFHQTIMVTTGSRRKQHEEFIAKVSLLSSLTPKERALVADVVATFHFNAGEVIMKQGDQGDRFYIMESGHCVASIMTPDSTEKDVKEYKSAGDYFGELSLLTNSPRAATVKALTETTCVGLDRDAFKRLLGPCTEILRRNISNYDAVVKNLL